jgi:hypothetical protein
MIKLSASTKLTVKRELLKLKLNVRKTKMNNLKHLLKKISKTQKLKRKNPWKKSMLLLLKL